MTGIALVGLGSAISSAALELFVTESTAAITARANTALRNDGRLPRRFDSVTVGKFSQIPRTGVCVFIVLSLMISLNRSRADEGATQCSVAPLRGWISVAPA